MFEIYEHKGRTIFECELIRHFKNDLEYPKFVRFSYFKLSTEKLEIKGPQ